MTFNFDYSNMVLAIGGQILLIIFALIILFMGAPDISFPVANVKKMLSATSNVTSAAVSRSASSV